MSTAEGTAGADASDDHDPYSYTKRDEFTSELHKIEIGNLPKMFGHGQLKKLLANKLKLNPHKIKIVGNKFAFVSFRSEEEREKALETVQGFVLRGARCQPRKPTRWQTHLCRSGNWERTNCRCPTRGTVRAALTTGMRFLSETQTKEMVPLEVCDKTVAPRSSF
uniref:Putative trm2 trna methyltransferase 2 log a n=1 Tax=Ixodes ricinus TaxID=34613 RepID=A0A0K8RHC0_IXORI